MIPVISDFCLNRGVSLECLFELRLCDQLAWLASEHDKIDKIYWSKRIEMGSIQTNIPWMCMDKVLRISDQSWSSRWKCPCPGHPNDQAASTWFLLPAVGCRLLKPPARPPLIIHCAAMVGATTSKTSMAVARVAAANGST